MNLLELIGVVINVFEAEKGHVLTITTKEKTFFIPIVKDEKTKAIYGYTGDVTIEELNMIGQIVSKINDSKIYPLPKFTLREKVLTDGPKALKKLLVPTGSTKMIATNFEERSKAAGYTLDDTGAGCVAIRTRDFSELLKRPDLKKIFDVNRNFLKVEGINSKDLTVQGELLKTSIKNGLVNGALITGPAGTGKSVLAKIIADDLNMPLVVMQISENTDADELVGSVMAVPTDSGKPDIKFVPGPLLDMWVNGGGFVAEEFNMGKSGVLSVLNTILDGSPYLTIATGEAGGTKFFRHPDFVCFATANPGYAGTQELNPSSTNRLSIVNVPDIPKEKFCEWGRKHSKLIGRELPKQFFEKLYDFATVIAAEAQEPAYNENPVFNIRNAKRLCEIILQENWDFEHFYGAICMEYINHLSVNNDNQELLTAYVNDETVKANARELYDLYAVTKKATEVKEEDLVSFDTLYKSLVVPDVEKPEGADDDEDITEKMTKKIKGKFGL